MSKELLVQHDPFLNQVADILTKPLSTTHFGRLKSKFSVVSLTTLTLRRSIKACVIKVLRLGMAMRQVFSGTHLVPNGTGFNFNKRVWDGYEFFFLKLGVDSGIVLPYPHPDYI